MVAAGPDALLRQGLACHQRGDLNGAEALYRQVLALRPRDANALNLLGQLARVGGDLPAAVSLTAQALAAQPGAPVFLASHGAALAEAGHLPQAERVLRAAVAARAADAVSWRNLGQVLAAQGRAAEALAPLRQAVVQAPADAAAHLALAHACREAGAMEEAVAEARLAAAEPALAAQAGFLLAALGAAEAPDRAPAAYVRELFDQYAPRFDQALEKLGYRTPALLAEMLAEAGVPRAQAVLDLGCGTGLSGVALAPFAKRLVGVDLSPRMLAAARARGIYHTLHEADLLDVLPRHPRGFGIIAAADVLNYLGDLSAVLPAMAAALAPGGIIAFSLERGEDAPGAPAASLGPGLRYRHSPAALRAMAAKSGLGVLAEQSVVLRQEQGAPVKGLLWLLRAG
jgi:predicted TPR repeat methyltransferase